MTLELSNSPGKPDIKTWFDTPLVVHLRGESNHLEITMSDFCHAIYYALTNTPLSGDKDPRLIFLAVVGNLEQKGNRLFYKGRECFSLVYPGDYQSEVIE